MNMNMDERSPPWLIVTPEKLEQLERWQPFRENWWRTVFVVALGSSSATVLLLQFFGRLT